MPRPATNASDRVAASRQVLMAAGLPLAARRLRRQLSTAARGPRRGAPAASAIVALALDDLTAGLRPQRGVALAADPDSRDGGQAGMPLDAAAEHGTGRE